MNQIEDVIGRYARLQLHAERYGAAGHPIPPNVFREIQAIEAWATTRLSPEQMQSAIEHVDHAKVRIMAQEHAHAQAYEQATAERKFDQGIRQLTRGMAGQDDGLSPEQFSALAQGKPLRVRRRPTQAEMDATMRRGTAALDPRGKGWDEAESVRRFDELAEADDNQFKRLAQNYRADPQKLRDVANNWKHERIAHGVLKRRRDAETEPESDPVINDDTRRRADVVGAYLGTVSQSDEAAEEAIVEQPSIRVEEEGRIGDVARAFEAHAAHEEETGAEA